MLFVSQVRLLFTSLNSGLWRGMNLRRTLDVKTFNFVFGAIKAELQRKQ